MDMTRKPPLTEISGLRAVIVPVTPFQQNCSVTLKLWPLGNDVTFVPGHGAPSTFGQERRANPFVADRVLARA